MLAPRLVVATTAVWSCLLADPAAADTVIDLTRLEWTVKEGFSAGDADGFPVSAGRRVEGFPILPNEIFHVKPGAPLQHYTLETTFELTGVYAPGGGLLGLHLAEIGENWALYVNGKLLEGAMSVRDGKLGYRRLVRNLIVALPPGMLRSGENRLVVHLAGDSPSTRLTSNTALGFFQRNGYHIERLDELQREHRDFGTLFVLAMFFLFTAYAAVLAWFRRHERHHVFFALLCANLAVYYFTRSRFVFDLVRDTGPVTRIEYATSFVSGALIFLFLRSFLEPGKPSTPFMRVYVPVSFTAAVAVLLAPFRYAVPLLLLWQAFSITAAFYMVWYIGRTAAARVPDAVSLIPSLFLFSMTVLWDITDSLFFRSGHRYSQYAFALFIATLAYVTAKRTVRKREETMRHLAMLREREARLSALFEATFEALVLHLEGRIVDANPSFTRMFGYTLDEMRGRHVEELFAGPVRLGEYDEAAPPGEIRARRRDGATFKAEYKNRPWAWNGVSGEVLSVRDIEASKRAESELRERNAELEILVRSIHDRENRLQQLETELAQLRKRRS